MQKLSNQSVARRILTNKILGPVEKLVAIAILQFRDEEKFTCDPHQDLISALTNLHRSKVARIVGSLKKAGVFVTILRSVNDMPRTWHSQYWFLYDFPKALTVARNQWQPSPHTNLVLEEIECVQIKLSGGSNQKRTAGKALREAASRAKIEEK